MFTRAKRLIFALEDVSQVTVKYPPAISSLVVRKHVRAFSIAVKPQSAAAPDKNQKATKAYPSSSPAKKCFAEMHTVTIAMQKAKTPKSIRQSDRAFSRVRGSIAI